MESLVPNLDPMVMADWQIAEAASEQMKSVQQLGSEMQLLPGEVLPYGHHVGKIDYAPVLTRMSSKPDGHYIDVTAMTPTPR